MKINHTEHKTLTDPSVSTIDNDLDCDEQDRKISGFFLLAQDQFLAQNVCYFSKRKGNSNGKSFWNEGNYLKMGLSKGKKEKGMKKGMPQTHDRNNIDQEIGNGNDTWVRTTKPVKRYFLSKIGN